MRDSLEGLSLTNDPLSDEVAKQCVTQRTGLEDWVRRTCIALACLWLLLGVVLPLIELVNRATHAEISVRIEAATPEEKAEDDFRVEINIAGWNVLLTMEEGKETVYVDNKSVPLKSGKAELEGLRLEVEDETIRRLVCDTVHAGLTRAEEHPIPPLEVEHTAAGTWIIDGKPLPPGDETMVVNSFIGLMNFFDYFGITDISQAQTLLTLASILVSIGLITFFLCHVFRPSEPFSQTRMLTVAVILLLAAQAFQSISFLNANMEASGLAQSVWNSCRVGFHSTLLSVVLAFFYAYGIHRTKMVGKPFFRLVAMLPLFAPTMLYGLSLVYLFGNKGIVTTGFFGQLPWLKWDINLYGFNGIVISEVVFTFPPAFMILLVALSNTDARLYEAAESLGAGTLRRFFTVTIPSVKFGLLSAVFVSFTLSFTDFGAPKIVGGQFNVLAVDIYKQVIGQQNFGMGATVSIILLVPTVMAFVADRIIQRRAIAVVTARSVPMTPKTEHLRDTVFFVIASLIALFILSMVFMAGISSLIEFWPWSLYDAETLRQGSIDAARYAKVWTLKHYMFEGVSTQYRGYTAFWNSVIMATLTAIVGATVTFVSAYLIDKTKGVKHLRQVAYFLSIIPLALPGLVSGIAYIFFFNKATFDVPFVNLTVPNPFHYIYGTMVILVVANIIHFYTVSFLTATTALRQLDNEFEAVSASMAVPFYKTFAQVTVPVCFPAILETAAYYFVSAMATVSAVIFLASSDYPLASVAVVNMDDAGDTAPAAAMCMLIVLTNVGVRSLIEFVSHTFMRKTQAWRKR